jgi:hypothetical protein
MSWHLPRVGLSAAAVVTLFAFSYTGISARERSDADLAGEWLATLTTSDVSDFGVYVTIERTGVDRYEGYSRSGALRQFVSWRQYVVGRLFGKLPPHLAAVHLDSITTERSGDSVIVRALFASQMLGRRRVMGSVRADTLRADLRVDTAGARVGSLNAVRTQGRVPLRDYTRLARSLADTMTAYVFNPRMMRTPAWREFFAELSTRFSRAVDDADAMASFYALLPRLGTSHINLTHDPRLANMSVDSALMRVSAPPESLVTLSFPAPGVALLDVRRWERVSDVVDRAFRRIESARAHTLIFDIRGNPGGDQSGLTTAGHLVSDSMYAGFLLGNRWYRDHESPPTPSEAQSLARSSKDDLLATFHMLRDAGVVVAFLPVRAPRFSGRVYLLTNGATGSASEPLAYVLKRTGRATLVGERTGGAILAAVPHHVGEGWVLALPEGDYYTADGVRLEGRGVEPDVKAPWRDALIHVADSLRARDGYAAALVAAQGAVQYLTRDNQKARGSLAERYAREAMRLAPDSVAPIAALGAAFIVDQRWDAGFRVMDSLATHHSKALAAHYQLGRLAALSGLRLDDGERSLRLYVAGQPPPGAATKATGFWRLGMILQKKGDIAGARHAYEAGLALEPTNGNLTAALRSVPTSPPH